ncbi:low molecular weight phosphatase family protein [Falsibacillus pallidus]|uniref:Protein-tyrosine-phosphatase n=1 Tax=Falsibacillus pallidus TaxID=493781 RepID=A0A370GWP9_9BACI|nr:low molecular weight phosphatase family protein [Falsibacillus pallidus]RDI47919.1 protein-tyrosine-phosphatase [Falsibacillus pallidus]
MTKKLLYFVSSHHGRSSMAEAWAKKLRLTDWCFKSGGWFDANRSPLTIQAMDELNIDLSSKTAEWVDTALLDQADYIVSIYDFHHETKIPIPIELKNKVIEWDIKNPNSLAETSAEKWPIYQEICDEIAFKVKHLEPSLKVIM